MRAREYTKGLTLWPIDQPDYPMAVVLSYNTADPHAVSLAFVLPGTCQTWTFGRNLLADALYAAAGEGLVRISPHEELPDHYLLVSLSTEGEERSLRWPAQFYVTRQAIEDVVDGMYDLVPMGREQVDVDSVIEQILSEVS